MEGTYIGFKTDEGCVKLIPLALKNSAGLPLPSKSSMYFFSFSAAALISPSSSFFCFSSWDCFSLAAAVWPPVIMALVLICMCGSFGRRGVGLGNGMA